MILLLELLLTLAVGGLVGIFFARLRFPNGLRIGALFGAAFLGIFFRAAWMPSYTKFAVQAIAGALVGCSMERSDLRRLPRVIKPTLIVLGTFLFLNLLAGTIIHRISPLSWVTALYSVVPGGITDIPIIASDAGADTPKVAVLQLARYIMGVAFFPSMIFAYDGFMQKAEAKAAEKKGTLSSGAFIAEISSSAGDSPSAEKNKAAKREKSKTDSTGALLCTLAVSFGAGFIGSLTGIPAGIFLFSIIGVLILKLKFDYAYISPEVKKVILWISGCYIGSLMTMEDVISFKQLALPVLIILGGYIINCFITGKIISRTCGFTRKEGLLITTPAGAADMALTSVDLGVENTDVIIIQIFRAIVAAAVFPQIINLLLLVLPE